MTVYAIGSTNDELLRELCGSDPTKRASAAETLGAMHDYLALPHLLTAARSDSDADVREAARLAVRVLLPSQNAADRAIAGESLFGPAVRPAGETRSSAAAAVIDAFRAYVAARKATVVGGAARHDMTAAVIGYIGTWGAACVEDLSDIDLAAAQAIGAIARHIEIPDAEAGCKWLSYRDAQVRVAAYDAARRRNGEPAHDPGSDTPGTSEGRC